jgi:CheY-like chemotaxis protein
VLLAEDNPVNQRVTLLLLRRLGHHVDIVGDGLEAVEAVARTSYDVVLMDVQMPHLDGLGATRTIRSRPGQHQPPIIALTGGDLAEDRAACGVAGMDAFLTKPLTLGALGTALADLSADVDTNLVPSITERQLAHRAPPGPPDGWDTTSREERIKRRLHEVAGPDPLDEDLDLFSSILRSFVERSPSLVDDLADAVLHHPVSTVQDQAHKLKGSAANLGGAHLAELLDRIEGLSRLGQRPAACDLEPVRAELVELRRSLTVVASGLESRSPARPATIAPRGGGAGGAPG